MIYNTISFLQQYNYHKLLSNHLYQLGVLHHLHRLLLHFVEGAAHKERSLRDVVDLSRENGLEIVETRLQVDELTGGTGEDFCDEERLTHKSLQPSRARHGHLVLLRELVHTQNGDDILQT